MGERVEYDEMSMFQENAEEFGLAWNGPPTVQRRWVALADGRRISGLAWGDALGKIVLLHGGAQNAHTWDTVALALDRPLLALDLPGHGLSDNGSRGRLDVAANAADLAVAIGELADPPVHLVGMSLGGITALALADAHPALLASLTLVDVTPGATAEKAAPITAFVNGPPHFDSFDDLLARTIEFNPTRSVSSLRRGILHNAQQQEDGTWVWRWARTSEPFAPAESLDFTALWESVDRLNVPLMLARGLRPGSVVDDEDERELRRRHPRVRVVSFPDAAHSIQGDDPVALANALAELFAG